jgi:hypothetical protein
MELMRSCKAQYGRIDMTLRILLINSKNTAYNNGEQTSLGTGYTPWGFVLFIFSQLLFVSRKGKVNPLCL